MSISNWRPARCPRAWRLAALCIVMLNAPCYALAQTSNSNAGANQQNVLVQPTPGNSPFTFVQPGSSSDKKPTKRADNGKNEK